MKSVSGVVSNLGFTGLLKAWNRILGTWDTMSVSYKKGMLNTLWEAIFLPKITVVDDDGDVHNNNLLYYITGDSNENSSVNKRFKNAVYVLFDALLKVFNVDYTNNVKNWSNYTLKYHNVKAKNYNITYKKVQNLFENILTDEDAKKFKDSISGQTLIMLGTLANNTETIIQSHYAEVYSAWLRSYDTYYVDLNGTEKETSRYVIKNKTDYGKFKVYAKYNDDSYSYLEESKTTNITEENGITLATADTTDTKKSTDGAMIQYRIKKGNGSYGKWNIYNDKAIKLDASSEDYTIQTRAIYLETLSDVSEFRVHVNTAKVVVSADINNIINETKDVSSKAISGSSITVSVDDLDELLTSKGLNLSYYKFVGWKTKNMSKSTVSSSTVSTHLSDTSRTHTDSMTSGYDSYEYIAAYAAKVYKVEFNYNQDSASTSYALTKAGYDKPITESYSNYSKPQYRVVVTESGVNEIYAEVTLYEDPANGIYFSSNLDKYEFNYNASYLESIGETTYTYNSTDGSITLTRQCKIKTIYTLTINYVDESNNKLAKSYSRKMFEGDTVSVTSPTIDGYTLANNEQATINYIMGTGNETINVIYNKIPEYTLTIEYTSDDADFASKKPANNEISLKVGETVTVASPSVEGYTPEKPTVTYKLETAGNKTYTVKYTKDEAPVARYTLTIKYVDDVNNELVNSYSTSLAQGEQVSITSPTIDGYTLANNEQATINYIMGTGNETINVIYNKIPEYTLTIEYTSDDADFASKKPANNEISLKVGETVTVASPSVEGYTPEEPTVTYKLETAGNKTYTVKYTKDVIPAYVTVEYKDANMPDTKLDVSRATYATSKGNIINISAPAQSDEEFIGWSTDGTIANIIKEGDHTYTLSNDGLTISFIVNDTVESVSLYGLYKPVVSKLMVVKPIVTVGETLATSQSKGLYAKVTDPYKFDTTLTWYKSTDEGWSKITDVTEEVEYETTYRAIVRIDPNDTTWKQLSGNFTILDGTYASLCDSDYNVLSGTSSYEIKKDDNGYYIEYIYTTEAEPAKVSDLASILEFIEFDHDTTKEAIRKGASEVKATVEMSDGTTRECSIILTDTSDIDAYVADDEYQIYLVKADVNLGDLNNPDNLEFKGENGLYILIGVNGLPEADEPESDKEDGLYRGTLYVNLSSNSDGTILYTTDDYWSLDDTEITWKEFKEGQPIELKPKYEVDEDGNYVTDEDGNLVPTDQIIYAYVTGTKGVSSSSYVATFIYQVCDLDNYVVKYDLNGGSPASGVNYDDMTIESGSRITLNEAPTKTGYTFTYWQINEDEQGLYKAGEELEIDEDTTIKALWQANTYTIVFNPNGADGIATVEYMTYDEPLALTSNPYTREGYTFVGWNTKQDGTGTSYRDGQRVNNLISEANGHITLYAQWRKNGSGNSCPTNYVWSNKTNSCIYKVDNTGSK